MLRVRRVEKPVRNNDVDLALGICRPQDGDGRGRSAERLSRTSLSVKRNLIDVLF